MSIPKRPYCMTNTTTMTQPSSPKINDQNTQRPKINDSQPSRPRHGDPPGDKTLFPWRRHPTKSSYALPWTRCSFSCRNDPGSSCFFLRVTRPTPQALAKEDLELLQESLLDLHNRSLEGQVFSIPCFPFPHMDGLDLCAGRRRDPGVPFFHGAPLRQRRVLSAASGAGSSRVRGAREPPRRKKKPFDCTI